MPSRRRFLAAVGAGFLAGCSDRPHETPTQDRTATPTGTSPPTATGPPTASPTPEETPKDAVCDRRWEADDRWRFGDDQNVGAVAAGAEAVFAATEEATVRLDPATGERVWRTPHDTVHDEFSPRQLHPAGGQLVATSYRTVVGFDTRTGSPAWSFTIPGADATAILTGGATAIGGTFYAGAENASLAETQAETPYSRLYAIDVSSGEPRLLREFSTADRPEPVLGHLTGNDRGLFCSLGDRLVGLEFDGTTRWRTGPVGDGFAAPVVAGDTVLAAAPVGSTTPGHLAAYRTGDGEQRWTDHELGEAVTVSGGRGYVTTEFGLTAFDPVTGQHYWEVESGRSGVTPTVADGNVFHVAKESGRLVAFDTEEGCRLGSFEYPGGDGGPLAASEGYVSTAGGEWQARSLWTFALPPN